MQLSSANVLSLSAEGSRTYPGTEDVACLDPWSNRQGHSLVTVSVSGLSLSYKWVICFTQEVAQSHSGSSIRPTILVIMIQVLVIILKGIEGAENVPCLWATWLI